MSEKSCDDCSEKLTQIEQRVKLLEIGVKHMESGHDEITKRFEAHMDKEENAFKSFYTALSELEQKISGIVLDGLKDMSKQRDDIRGEIKDAGAHYITRKEAVASFVAVGAAISIVVFLFSTFSVAEKSVDSEIENKIDFLISEIRRQNG